MGLKYNLEQNLHEVFEVEFIKKHKEIKATSKDGHDLVFDYPLPITNKYLKNPEDFTIHLFFKENFAANHIYQIEIDRERIGWLFPIVSLISSEHDYVNNEHFYPYSENAYLKLLRADDNIPHQCPMIADGSKVSLEDFYGSNTIVIILFKESINSIEQKIKRPFSLDEYLVHLYSLGYVKLDSGNFDKFQRYVIHDQSLSKEVGGQAISLKSISTHLLGDCEFINLVFKGMLKFELHHLVKFHFLYQIVELLISKIFEIEFKELMPEFSEAKKVYDAREKLTKLVNEKSRIEKLFNSYSHCSNKDELKESCTNLIRKVNLTPLKSHSDSLYKVRSLLFHNYREIPTGDTVLFDKVNEEFEQSVFDLLIHFKIPKLIHTDITSNDDETIYGKIR